MEMQRSTARAQGRAGGAPKQAAESKPTAEERRGPQSGRAQEAGGRGKQGAPRQESCPDPLAMNAERLWALVDGAELAAAGQRLLSRPI